VIIGLIGMSGAGKSTWARRLAASGWRCLDCDDLIAAKLRTDVDIGAGSVYDLGRWMGLPYEPSYAAREALYLRYETEVLAEIASSIARQGRPQERVVVDMTGSAIYVDPAVLARVRQLATIVYLAIAPQRHQQMCEEYRAQPRPVLWNGLFQPLPGEDRAAALARCYTHLISVREGAYEAICDVKIDEALHQHPAFTPETFVRYVAMNRRARHGSSGRSRPWDGGWQ